MDAALALVLPGDRAACSARRRQRMGRQPLSDDEGLADPAFGRWTVADDRLCIESVRRRCLLPVVNGDRIELFDRYGVTEIDAVALPQ